MKRFRWMRAAPLLLAACGGKDAPGNTGPNIVQVAAVAVAPATVTINTAATQQLTATVTDAAGNTLTGRTIAWSSSDVSRATVDGSGVVTGVAVGVVTITATSEGKAGAAMVTVAAAAGCAAVRPIALGVTATGSISSADCRLSDGSYAQKWELNLAASTAVQVEMTSDRVDSYLHIINAASGAIVAKDDDAGGAHNAKIEKVLPAARYVIYANTFNAGEFGAYQLAVRSAPTACLSARPLAVPQTASGTLSATTSCRLQDESLADRYQVTVAVRTTLQFDMTSTAVDAYLFVQNSSGTVLGQDDDGLSGTDASLTITLEPGTYIINANSFEADETGPYQLIARVYSDPCLPAAALQFGTPLTGSLGAGACVTESGSFVHRYTMTVATAATVRVDMTNTGGLDPYLVVQNAATGAVVAEDDDAGGALNARIQGLFQPGTYIVNATTYSPGETGTFRLTAAASAPTTPVAIAVTPATLTIALGQTQTLNGTVTGSTNTTITWTSSAPAVATVSSTGVVRGLTTGVAVITGTAAADPSKVATATVTVQAAGGSSNLDIASAYVVQAVQTLNQNVPLVENRAAMARVFVRGSQAGLAAVRVRLRVYDAGVLASTLSATATPQTTVNEGCCVAAEFALPAALVHQGMALLADVDPDNTVPEASESDNAFPLSGTPMQPAFIRSPDFNIRLVPVRQSKNNRTGTASPALLNHVQSLWPISKMNVSNHTTYVTDLPPLESGDANGSWSNLLKEIDALRRLENSDAYYYGIVNPAYTSGVVGLGYISGKSAIGVDWGNGFGSVTLAHELGHNFSRHHAPCSGAYAPANVDQSYPFANGTTGIFGIDLFNGNTRYTPTATDIMSYCDNQWVSSYNYLAVANYRSTTLGALVAALPAAPVLIISGNINRNGLSVDPVFISTASPDRYNAGGTLEAVGRSSAGRVLFRHRFHASFTEDGDTTQQAYVTSVPVSEEWRNDLMDVEVREVSQTLRKGVRNTAQKAAAQAFGAVGLQATASGSAVQFQWDTRAYPAVVVRNKRTGEVLERSRSGTASLATATSDDLEILMSTGVGSVSRTFVRASGLVRP